MSQRKKSQPKALTEDQIDEIVTSQANDESAWEEPVEVHRPRGASLSIPAELAARAAFLAGLHRTPAAFYSYSRSADQHVSGRITELKDRLQREVRLLTGREDFTIFQDSTDIRWGQEWEARIGGAIQAATLFIPVFTPSYFQSPVCRRELEQFLERENALGRSDLVLPIYYVDVPYLNDPTQKGKDSLMDIVASRQYSDWRELRLEASDNPRIFKAVAQLARQMRDVIVEIGEATGIDVVLNPPKTPTRAVMYAVKSPSKFDVTVKKDDEIDWISLLPAFSHPNQPEADLTILTVYLSNVEVVNHDVSDTEIHLSVVLWDPTAQIEVAPIEIKEEELLGQPRLRARCRREYGLKFTAVFEGRIPRENRSLQVMLRAAAIGLGKLQIALEDRPQVSQF